MFYCVSCQRMAQDKCPHCGKPSRKLREIKDNDPVLFYHGGFIPSTMIEPLLADNGIPYSKEGRLGAGFVSKAGGFLEQFDFYVPYGVYPQAVRLISDTFSESPDILCGLDANGLEE